MARVTPDMRLEVGGLHWLCRGKEVPVGAHATSATHQGRAGAGARAASRRGKVRTIAKCPMASYEQLATRYSPGAASPACAIAARTSLRNLPTAVIRLWCCLTAAVSLGSTTSAHHGRQGPAQAFRRGGCIRMRHTCATPLLCKKRNGYPSPSGTPCSRSRNGSRSCGRRAR